MPTLDGSTPAFVTGTSNPATTASFTPPANAAIFAICFADELNTFAVSNTGTTLTWSSIGTPINQSGEGSIAVFRAYTGGTSPGSITVSSIKTGSFTANALQILVFTNTEITYTGAYATALTATVNITTTAPNSWVWAGHIEENGTTDPAASGCAYNNGPTAFGGIAGGVLKRTATTPSSGTVVTIGVTGVTIPDIIAFEVKDAPSGLNTLPGIWPSSYSPGLQRLQHQTSFATPFQMLGDETAVTQTNYAKSVSDQVGIADAIANARNVTVSDAVGLTDSVRVSVTKGLTDAIGITDTRSYTDGENQNDPIGITDSTSRVVTAVRSPADPVGVTDTATFNHGKTQSDAVGITDSATGVISLTKTVTDPVGIADTQTKSRGTSLGDAVGLIDAVSTTKTVVRTVSDAVGVTDTRAYSDGENQNDPVPITDTRTIARGTSRTDPVGVTDTRAITVGRNRIDNVGVTDTRAISRQVTITDAINVTDARTTVRSFHVTIGDAIGITDYIPSGVVRDISVTLDNGPHVRPRNVQSSGLLARAVTGSNALTHGVTGPQLRPLITSSGIQPRAVNGPTYY